MADSELGSAPRKIGTRLGLAMREGAPRTMGAKEKKGGMREKALHRRRAASGRYVRWRNSKR
jgi:hypothetical protein